MKQTNYIVLIAFIFALVGYNFLQKGNFDAGMFMMIPTMGTVLVGEILNKTNDK
tara:strand:+ start:1638 stop:1799 length:162 start_codon:yes stop_codon:yes gene_type:complete